MTKEEYLKLSEEEQKRLFNYALEDRDMQMICAERSFNRNYSFGRTNVIIRRLNGGRLATVKPYEVVCGEIK